MKKSKTVLHADLEDLEDMPEYVDKPPESPTPSSPSPNSFKQPNGKIVLAELTPLPLPKKYTLLSGSR